MEEKNDKPSVIHHWSRSRLPLIESHHPTLLNYRTRNRNFSIRFPCTLFWQEWGWYLPKLKKNEIYDPVLFLTLILEKEVEKVGEFVSRKKHKKQVRQFKRNPRTYNWTTYKMLEELPMEQDLVFVWILNDKILKFNF